MRKIVALVLTMAILLSSGLMDIIAWASESISEGIGDSVEVLDTPENPQDNWVSIPIVDLGEIVTVPEEPESDIEPQGAETEDEDTQLVYASISGSYCEIVGYNGTATELVIPQKLGGYTVRNICDSAFAYNDTLERVELPGLLESIGDYAFENCSELMEIVLPDSVEHIGYYAFGGCERLADINYPASLVEVGGYIFADCVDLIFISVPDGITELPSSAFSGCSYLEGIELPDSLAIIGEYAFERCESLETVELPADLEEIGYGAFYECNTLETIVIPKMIEEIPASAFAYCSNLTKVTLPDGLESIGDYAFEHCEELEQIVLPDSVEYIGYYAFGGCERLTDINYPESLAEIGGSIFDGCTDLTYYEIPEGVVELPAYIFSGCSNFEEIKLPESLEIIGEGAFEWCSSLETIELPVNLEEIGHGAFHNCESLETIVIPEMIEEIPDSAFAYCSNLTEVTLPDGLETVGDYAFEHCEELKQIVLPDSVEYIGYYAFGGCERLTDINYPESLTEIGGSTFDGCTDLTYYEIPEGVVELPAYIFSGCSNFEEIKLPESLEIIGEGAFEWCSSLETIELPVNLEEIGRGAFSNCESLETIVIPEMIEEIPDSAFAFCTSLTDVTLVEGLTSIGEYAFENCADLRKITLPDSVECIGYYAFGNCQRLTSVNYPANLNECGGNIFTDCKRLKSIEVPDGVSELPAYVFYGSNYLEQVVLPQSLETIGENAFDGCCVLEEISIPDGVEFIGEYAFAYCGSLSSVSLPDGLIYLAAGVFDNCTELEAVVLPDNLERIEECAFYNCRELKAIWLPESVTYIGWYTFADCASLTEVQIPESVTEIDYDAFSGIPGLIFRCSVHAYAAVYAIDNGIPIIPINGGDLSELYELDMDNSYFDINMDGISSSGNLSMVAKYVFKDGSDAEPDKLVFTIPESVMLLEKTLTINGVLCTDYEYDEEAGMLYVYVEEMESIVRFSLKPINYDEVTTYAKIEFYNGNGEYRSEVVGAVYTELPILNISALSETSETSVEVSGVTIPRNSVTLYINGAQVTTIKANRSGDYSATLQLPSLSNGKRYTIKAESTDTGGNVITAETVVTYKESTPVLSGFVMEHYGQTIDMDDVKGMRPVVTFAPGEVFKFFVWFENGGNIERVYIVSTRNNIRRSMEAKWDASSGAYVAEGLFDKDDESYVPGAISIEYVLKSGAVSFTDGYNFYSQESINELPDEWKNMDIQVSENTDDRTEITVQIDAETTVNMVTEQTEFPSGVTESNAQSLGYTRMTDDYGRTVYIRQYREDGKVGFEILDLVKEKAYDQFFYDPLMDAAGLGDVGTAFDVIDAIIETVENTDKYYDHKSDYDQMYYNIVNDPNLSASEKEYALQELNAARTVNALATFGKYACTAAGLVAGVTLGPVAGFVVGVGLGLVSQCFDDLQDYARDYMLDLPFWLRWSIDPSGYVYDASTGNRIQGVTVTAYWIPYDESVAEFWDTVPDADEYGVIWDSSEFSQINPMSTDQDGRYAWDVPEGWWRVEYVMEGYETTWSEWLPVPPPQTEVNVGMIPLAETILPGDINGDGEVDNKDLTRLFRYLSNYDVEVVEAALDINGDEEVNNKDLIRLFRYLSDWDVVIN